MGCPVYFLTKKGYPGQVTAILPPPDAPPGASRRRHPGFCHTARGADISVLLIEMRRRVRRQDAGVNAVFQEMLFCKCKQRAAVSLVPACISDPELPYEPAGEFQELELNEINDISAVGSHDKGKVAAISIHLPEQAVPIADMES